MRSPVLEGANIRLRPWQVTEASWYVEARDDEIFRWTSEPRDLSAQQVAASIESGDDLPDVFGFAVADVATDGVMGNFPVSLRDNVATLAYWLAPESRGRGLATEALLVATDWVLGEGLASAAELEIHPDNTASRRVAEKAGFIEVGHRPSDRNYARDVGQVVVYRREATAPPEHLETDGRRPVLRQYGQAVLVVKQKWGGVAHGSFPHVVLGTDAFGAWLYHPADPELPWASVALIPESGWWTAYWVIEDGAEHKVYVDIATPAVWSDDAVTYVDLEMDVERFADTGETTLLDAAEFEQRRQACRYPDHVVAAARAASAQLFEQVRDRLEPFDRVGPRWIEVAFGAHLW